MSNTIWAIQVQEDDREYSSDKTVTEHFWFTKPTVAQLIQYGFAEEKAKAFLRSRRHKGEHNTRYLREVGEGSLE